MLVHGARDGGWAWQGTARTLRAAGYEAPFDHVPLLDRPREVARLLLDVLPVPRSVDPAAPGGPVS